MMGLIGKDVGELAATVHETLAFGIENFVIAARAKGFCDADIAKQSVTVAASVMLSVISKTTDHDKILETARNIAWLFPDALEEALDEMFE